ncbi:hypothetical protein H257_17947 [Aphanomyces astaci]|uniref:Uncharacterized protein n=1 Tax=Aphanomyces astaci TaxID=112090 RepID=W4FCU8_APHAT|nr:hypothetical protein H257_17947 [Aphanomyces astaci]ETV65295.1 hypothetical protein H257_17947 [Aphanomyces astaci]|eukprot:XP_009845221.1 hypothetical protein H257_17947 [Aphanomyces astaci]
MGEYDHLGAILEQSSATKVSLKTTRWTQGPIIATFWKRMRQTLAPPLHSHTFSFASYCLNNSDCSCEATPSTTSFFTAPNQAPPTNASHSDLAYLGFVSARLDVDMLLTTGVVFHPPRGKL